MKSRVTAARALPDASETPETPPATIHRLFPWDLWECVRNRMVVGASRFAGRGRWYEETLEEPMHEVLVRLQAKLLQFVWTRNLEYLVDVVVYICLIWRFANEARVHFEAEDREAAGVQEMRDKAATAARAIMRQQDHRWRGVE